MSDWEIVNNKFTKNSPSSDWEIVHNQTQSEKQPNNESYGQSLLSAIPRVGEDLIKGGVNAAKSIPSYIESGKTEIPGLLNLLQKNPALIGKQALAGLTESGHNLLNLPHGISNYLSNRLNLIPQSVTDKIPNQKDISSDINQTFGQPSQSGENLARGIGRNAINALGTSGAAKALNPFQLTAGNIAKDILKTETSNKNLYGKKYNKIFDKAEKQGYYDMSNSVPQIDIKTLSKYSPEKKIEGVREFIENPNVQTAHTAKSDLLSLERELNKKTSLTKAERNHLDATQNAIESIQQNMFKNNEGKINKNLMDEYADIQKGYRDEVVPYKNKKISAFKRNELSSKELVNALSHGEFMAKRGQYHKALKARKMVPWALGGGTAIGAGAYGYNKLFGNNEPKY